MAYGPWPRTEPSGSCRQRPGQLASPVDAGRLQAASQAG